MEPHSFPNLVEVDTKGMSIGNVVRNSARTLGGMFKVFGAVWIHDSIRERTRDFARTIFLFAVLRYCWEAHPSKDTTMEKLKATFSQCKKEGRSALVTYVTAGYPTAEETPDIMLGMEAGGAGKSIDCVSGRDI